jgi:hypothetical protein
MLAGSGGSNIISPIGNSLAIFLKYPENELFLKDINGKLQPLSDFVDLLNPAFINYFDFTTSTTTPITQSQEWVKIRCTSQEGFKRNGLELSQFTKVTNTGSKKLFRLQAIISLSSGNNNEIHASFFKNEFIVPCSEETVVTSSGGKASALPIQCVVELDTNDFVEIYVKNQSGTSDIICRNINVIISQQ